MVALMRVPPRAGRLRGAAAYRNVLRTMIPCSRRNPRGTPLLAGVAVCAFAAAAQPETRDVIVDDPRPVPAALQELATRHGRVVTYEDPRYLYSGDIKDVTREVRRDLDRFPPGQAPKVLVPL